MIFLLPFLGVAGLFVITPGPNIALVTRNALRFGRRAGLLTSFGVLTGVAFSTMIAALGIGALLASNATAFSVLEFAGAIYLIYLGARVLLSLKKRTAHQRFLWLRLRV